MDEGGIRSYLFLSLSPRVHVDWNYILILLMKCAAFSLACTLMFLLTIVIPLSLLVVVSLPYVDVFLSPCVCVCVPSMEISTEIQTQCGRAISVWSVHQGVC